MKPSYQWFIRGSQGTTIKLVNVGDLCFPIDRTHPDWSAQMNGLYGEEILEILEGKDVSVANLECVVDKGDGPSVKSGPNLLGGTWMIEALRRGRFDVVTLANNHIMDFGQRAMETTVKRCQEAGMRTVGAGANEQEALQPIVVQVKGISVAILALAEEEFGCATATRGGAAKMDPILALGAVKRAKECADVVIVNVHGGSELYPLPSPRLQAWFRLLVEQGASAVIGHHPHVIQPAELYRGVPIIYSLGNFAFPGNAGSPRGWYVGMIASLSIDRQGVYTVDLYLHDHQRSGESHCLRPLGRTAEADLSEWLRAANEIVVDEERVMRSWRCFCWEKRDSYLNHLKVLSPCARTDSVRYLKRIFRSGDVHGLGSLVAELAARCLVSSIRKQQSVAKLCNIIRAPAHVEVLQTILTMELEGVIPTEKDRDEYRALAQFCR